MGFRANATRGSVGAGLHGVWGGSAPSVWSHLRVPRRRAEPELAAVHHVQVVHGVVVGEVSLACGIGQHALEATGTNTVL